MMMRIDRGFLINYALISLLLLALFVIFFDINYAISSLSPSFSGFVVVISSYFAYKKMVDNRVYNEEIVEDERDELDKIDDKYELFSEDEEDENLSKKEADKKSAKELKNSVSGALSIYRIASYALLIYLFFVLKDSGYFSILGYVCGFLAIPISTLLSYKSLKAGFKDEI